MVGRAVVFSSVLVGAHSLFEGCLAWFRSHAFLLICFNGAAWLLIDFDWLSMLGAALGLRLSPSTQS